MTGNTYHNIFEIKNTDGQLLFSLGFSDLNKYLTIKGITAVKEAVKILNYNCKNIYFLNFFIIEWYHVLVVFSFK